MLVKIQLLFDDGRMIVEHVHNAGVMGGWETHVSDGPVIEGSLSLYGFTYLPIPPPRHPEDVAEFRRMLSEFRDEG